MLVVREFIDWGSKIDILSKKDIKEWLLAQNGRLSMSLPRPFKIEAEKSH